MDGVSCFFEEYRIDGVTYLSITEWIDSEFSHNDGLHITNKIGKWSFFQSYEKRGLDRLEFLEFLENSLKAKKDAHVYEQVIKKLKCIAPTEFGCEPEMYARDSRYRTWFSLRESFFSVLNEALLKENSSKPVYFVWGALSDIYSHPNCLDLHNKVFNIDEPFIAIAEQHWAKVRGGCRCYLSVLNERQLAKRNLEAP